MSTRTQIGVEGSNVLIYKHSDGYPEGVLPVLTEQVQFFFKHRGPDPEYCLAQILRAFARFDDKVLAEQLQNDPYYKNTDYRARAIEYDRTCGWGLDTEIHGDIEYFYWVKASGDIEVYEVSWGGFDLTAEGPKGAGLILDRTIPFTKGDA